MLAKIPETDFEILLGLKQKLEQVGCRISEGSEKKGSKEYSHKWGGGGGSGDIHLE